MFKGLTHKRKFQLLLAGLVIAPFLVYWIAISDTVAAATKCRELNEQYAQTSDMDRSLAEMRAKVNETSLALGMVDGDVDVFQSELLSSVSVFCKDKGLELIDFAESEVYVESGMHIETIPLTVEGGFEPTVRLIHYLETEAKVGRLVSTELKLVKVRKSQKEVLQTTIHVQNVTKES